MSVALVVRVALLAPRMQMRSCRHCTSAATKGGVVAAKLPFKVDLEANKLYGWCACGHSQKQPFCDGSHKSVPQAPDPVRFRLENAETVFLCGCKQTKRPPYCDGTHKEDWIQRALLHTTPSLE
ncbi:CDGSH iron-sulfur domain-containing protein 3, mitochondrial-like isoform X1 [Leucoraja erinacea]|uniref:CDGSH iron-sulfur domain-containing protein 3, mitochondrial-like isoform X1 n=2 Tax=Leucoraja erinaceus TaxID=7782 RepID=UPI002457D6ED|nr:CDGSH iron-sulfur domain-containing protein 3, mitochondrial-like isoform X1 [Leucoraja erinacea]